MLLESGIFLQKKIRIGNFLRKSISLDEWTGSEGIKKEKNRNEILKMFQCARSIARNLKFGTVDQGITFSLGESLHVLISH